MHHVNVRILFLGPARDLAGANDMPLALPSPARVAHLRAHLLEHLPPLRRALTSMRFAVNQTFAEDDAPLHDGDEVAVIPPVSGGAAAQTIWVELVDGPIPAGSVRDFVVGDSALGGIVTFEGATRAEKDAAHGELVRLDYEAYASMAQRQLEALAQEAQRRWSLGRVVVIHRLRSVAPGEVSVMIAVAAAHRAEAFAACRWLIDTLKRDVPIWKKDVFADGFTRWVEPTIADGANNLAQPTRRA